MVMPKTILTIRFSKLNTTATTTTNEDIKACHFIKLYVLGSNCSFHTKVTEPKKTKIINEIK